MLLNYFSKKIILYCWIINYHKTTGIVKNATTNSFYLFCGSLWQITILVMNLWSYVTPRVIFWLSSADSGMLQAVEYGIKYNLILVPQAICIDKYSCPSCILRTLLKNHLILTNVMVFCSLENIYLEQCSPCIILECHSTTFLTFQHHLQREAWKALFNVKHSFSWLRGFLKSGLIACCSTTFISFYFCRCFGQTCWRKCLVVEL